ncbi:hypothetical protein [Escherichia coli]|uniref:hypothetical protein n=1 Tax=Escherichia coli TaxID=562 RepID=UPI0010DDB2A8|nr:hypothetical protein [Escherichia coli]EFB3862148.1 hypothetical protein [Escherichia coli]GDO98322.1 hypothetical protein BvCmsNSNP012_01620 [Escherichia coli]
MGMVIIIGGLILFVVIILTCLLCKGIGTIKNPLSVAQFCMVILLAPLLGIVGYIIYVAAVIFSNTP